MHILITILQRLAYAALLLIAVLVLNFSMMNLAPGDVADTIAASMGGADAELMAQIRAEYGLDQPFLVQLVAYITRVMSFDLGYSYFYNAPVTELIFERLPATLLLTATAFVISIVFGVIAGVLAAQMQGTWWDTLISSVALLFYATPLFWVALMASLLFSVVLGWLPGFGYETIGADYTGFARMLDIGRHLILPATTLGLFFTAIYVRMTRASMLEVSRLDFVKTARAKGLRNSLIQRRHVLRNALLPVITLAGLQAGQIVGGAVLTETVFAWPGIGRLMFEAIGQRDYNVILGVFFVSAAMVLLFNLITDILYGIVDPRIRLAR